MTDALVDDIKWVFTAHGLTDEADIVDASLVSYLMEAVAAAATDETATEMRSLLLSFFPEAEHEEVALAQIAQLMTAQLQERQQRDTSRRTQIVRPPTTTAVDNDDVPPATNIDNATAQPDDFSDVDNAGDRDRLLNLSALVPDLPTALVRYVYYVMASGHAADAGTYLLDHGTDEESVAKLKAAKEAHDRRAEQAAAQEAAEARRVRASMLKKFDGKFVPVGVDCGSSSSSTSSSGKAKDRAVVPPPPPTIVAGAASGKIRYLGSQVVSTKVSPIFLISDPYVVPASPSFNSLSTQGEKVLIIKNPADDYDGGSRGIIKTKGKRGPGFVRG